MPNLIIRNIFIHHPHKHIKSTTKQKEQRESKVIENTEVTNNKRTCDQNHFA